MLPHRLPRWITSTRSCVAHSRAVDMSFVHPGTSTALIHTGAASRIPLPPQVAVVDTDYAAEARAWTARFKTTVIPKSAVEMSFSRSSGPGGQNVNKVSTKATLRCPLDSTWIPLWARTELKKSPYYVSSSQSILITSTVTRSQSQNVDDCLSKLHNLVLTASSAGIKNEPTQQTKDRVAALVKANDARRRVDKTHKSSIKRTRSSKSGGWD